MAAETPLSQSGGGMSAALAQRQAWLLAAITAEVAPARLTSVLARTAVAPSIGLEVYRHAYRARLRECVADDFPAVEQILGSDSFAALADRYIAELPPQASTLNAYSKAFPTWLRQQRLRQGTYLAQMADLEWALIAAIHAPLAPPLALTALHQLDQDGWATARLLAIPSLHLIRHTWAINDAYNAYRSGKNLPQVASKRGAVAVFRRARGLQRLELDLLQATVLSRLARGQRLATALADLDAGAAGTIQSSFRTWFAAGLFTALR
jgi:hypothetical protein